MSYVRLKHTLSAIALKSLADPGASLAASAMAAYARRSEAGADITVAGGSVGGAVPLEALARDLAADPGVVRGALLDTGLFDEEAGGVALAPAYRPHAAYFRRQAARLVEALRLAAGPAPPDVPLDVRRGAALFNAGLYFEAHEYWEDVWRAGRPPERAFYHGLVQAAAGRYHAEKGNVHGAAVLLAKARAKLEPYAPRYLGVDIEALLVSLAAVRADAPPQEAPAVAFASTTTSMASGTSRRSSTSSAADASQLSLLPASAPVPAGGRPAAMKSQPIGGRIYVGTCSWAEKSFVKSDFYPSGVRSAPDRLRYYAGRFPTVEVDASYFALLPPAYSRRWAEETPPGFMMNAKAFGLFTGHGAAVKRLPSGFANLLPQRLRDAAEVKIADVPEEFRNACWDAYREFLAPLAEAGKLGYVLFQLPPGARYSTEAVDEMARWREELAGRKIAVEFRHRSWSRHPEVLDELARLGLAYVMVDLPDLPWLMPPVEAVTSDVAVIRFHGRNRDGWARAGASTDQRYNYEYSGEELRHWAGVARRLAERADTLYAMFNNHVGGAMARDARTLADLLEAG